MSEPRISRVVVGALHQSLSDHLPLRLDFYEEYLRPMRLREGRIGAASFLAALSFLRLEGSAWDPVMVRAGRHAADWVFDGLSPVQRTWYRHLPARWRFRNGVHLARDLVVDTMPKSRARLSIRRRHGRLEIRGSPFCEVRERVSSPMCRFYAAALERFCELLDVDIRVKWEGCRAMGDDHCALIFQASSDQAANARPGERVAKV
jgi:hypothetical protein